jgi:cytochrome d ubiquinol oxidase subunit II
VILSGVCGLVVLVLLTAGRLTHGVRIIAALGVAAVVWGWGVAQYPVLLPSASAGPGAAVTLANAGAPHATLVALVVVFIAAVLLVGPSFALLFALQQRRLLSADEATPPLPSAIEHPGSSGRPPAGG